MTTGSGRTRWISAHLFHAGNLDTLLTRLLAPLVADLDLTGSFFFLRYWEGGPHLRLRLRPADPGHAEQVTRELTRRSHSYLAAYPSHRALTADQYRILAPRLAGGERLPTHDPSLHPNDTIEFIAYQPEHHAYGDATCMAAVETHFTTSSRLALDMLTAHPEPARRAAIALAAVTLTLAACATDPSGFSPAALPATVHDHFQTRRDDLLRQTRSLWSAEPGGVLGAWHQSVATLRQALLDGHCARDAGSPLGFLARAAPPEERAITAVLLRCTHLLNNRLGLSSTTEHHIALLAAHALSTLHQTGDLP
ncbi:thiopeptide-type bacteriocin biosynthesis protein [Nonomuraea sp. NPDC001699]